MASQLKKKTRRCNGKAVGQKADERNKALLTLSRVYQCYQVGRDKTDSDFPKTQLTNLLI